MRQSNRLAIHVVSGAVIASCISLAPPAGAAPPAPAPTSFIPAIAYTYSSSNATDLRLANEAGTAALLVFRQANAMQFDLSPQTAHRIAYVASTGIGGSNATVQYKVWDASSGNVTLGAANTVFATSRSVRGLDFSPEGNRLAFGSDESSDTKLIVYDFAGSGTGLTTLLAGYRIYNIRWRSDGLVIYFTGYPANTSEPMKVYEIAADGASGPTAFFDVAVGTNPVFDTTRTSAPGSEKLLIDYRPGNTGAPYLRAYNRDSSYSQLGAGTAGHYNCNNDRIIYTEFATRKPRTLIGNADLTSSTVWSTDSNISKTDWMPC